MKRSTVERQSQGGRKSTAAAAAGRGAVQDAQSVSRDGALLPLPVEGAVLRRLAGIYDHRGSLTPVIDSADPIWAEPVVHAYCVVLRPGNIKGWGMHARQVDRYFVPRSQLRVVLFDGRQGSPSEGMFAQIYFTPETPGLLRIPSGVWHAVQNWGNDEGLLLNFPTERYDPERPDKQRIDPHAGIIPFDWTLRDS